MTTITCITCQQKTSAFRKISGGECVWCQWAPMARRAKARYADKLRAEAARRTKAMTAGKRFLKRLKISERQFISWYCNQPDQCFYCGITRAQVQELSLRRGGFGYFVSWDIDRKDSAKPYQLGNLALACFMCNMAKGNYFTESEAKVLGKTIGGLVRSQLKASRANAA